MKAEMNKLQYMLFIKQPPIRYNVIRRVCGQTLARVRVSRI